MSAGVLLFLFIRVLHVLLAGIWLGSAFFLTLFLMPATQQMGPTGGQVMTTLTRRGLTPFMAALGGTVILTGFYLFWRFTGGFDPVVSASRAGMAYSIGALCGLIAAVLGGSVIGRGVKKMVDLGAQIASAPDSRRGALMSELETIRARVGVTSKFVLVLLIIAMATMALGHYV